MDIFEMDNTLIDEELNREKYLIFTINKEQYGVDINNVAEIIGMMPITYVPKVPEFVKGVINARGKVIPVIDMRIKFGKEPTEYNDRTSIMVVNIKDMVAGLIVDRVLELRMIPEENIVPPPDFKSGFHNRFINKIGIQDEKIVLLIDCDLLLKEEEYKKINKIKQN